jgi:signal transduction histidine kinase
MEIAPLPENEDQRIEALRLYDILDTEFEAIYDEITELAASICETPIALISFVDRDRQWFKSKVGLEARETHRDFAFCPHVFAQKDNLLIVPDASQDRRFADNPLVTEQPNIRFYAGAALIAPGNLPLGTICVIDREPRVLNEMQTKALNTLSKQVVSQLELRLSVRRLQELNASKDKFFSIIAHDLRSPFSGLLGFSEMLLTELDTLDREECRELATDICSCAKTAYALTENLLQWANLETGQMSWEKEEITVDAMIVRAIAPLQGVAKQKQISLQFIPNPVARVFADIRMVSAIVQNLVSNALKFTHAHGQVIVCSEVLENAIKITVSDTGVGISAEKIPNLFQMGTHISTDGTTGETGTGLGLLLCQQFASKHGGEIGLSSAINKGSQFYLTLPLSDGFKQPSKNIEMNSLR